MTGNYTSNNDRNIYAIYNLPEEVIAVLFAFYSRSKGSLRENLQKMINDGNLFDEPNWVEVRLQLDEQVKEKLDQWLELRKFGTTEQAKNFHEKWVLNFGHASCAEHSIIHLAIEEVSMLAAKAIEDCRLASYTEKSTRYVVYDNIGFTTPSELSGMSKDIYKANCQDLIDFYLKSHSTMSEKIKSQDPELKPGQVRSKACDICRNILPVSMHTNLGMTINARVLVRTIVKMLSSKNEEFIRVANQMKEEALKVCPTLLKYTDKNDYIEKLDEKIKKHITTNSIDEQSKGILKTNITEDEMLRKLVQSILLERSQMPYDAAEKIACNSSVETCQNILQHYCEGRSAHDDLLRVFEQVYLTHEIVVDFGAYRDIQRHRMNTQISQLLTPKLGYVVPDEFQGTDLELDFENKMKRSERIYYQILVKTNDPKIAQYCLPMAFRKRVIFNWNLREMSHFVNLRKRPTGHKNYIEVAKQIEQNFNSNFPFIGNLVFD